MSEPITHIIITRLRSSHSPFPGDITSIEELTDGEIVIRRIVNECDKAMLRLELNKRMIMDAETERLVDMVQEGEYHD